MKRGRGLEDAAEAPPAKEPCRFRTIVYPSGAGFEMFGFYKAQSDFRRVSTGDKTPGIDVTLPFFPSNAGGTYALLDGMSTSLSIGEAVMLLDRASPEAIYNVVRAYDYLVASDELVERTKAVLVEKVESTNSSLKTEYIAACTVAGATVACLNLKKGVAMPEYVHSLDIVESIGRVIGGVTYRPLRQWMYRVLHGVLPPINEIYARLRRIAPLAFHCRDVALVVAGGALLQCFVHDGGTEAWANSDVDYFIRGSATDAVRTPRGLVEALGLKRLDVEWCARTSDSTVRIKLAGESRMQNVIFVSDKDKVVYSFDMDCVLAYYRNGGVILVCDEFLQCLAQRTCMARDDAPMKNLSTAARAAKYAARGFAPPPHWPQLVEPYEPPATRAPRMRLERFVLDTKPFVPLRPPALSAFGYEGVCDAPPIIDRNFFYEGRAHTEKVPGGRTMVVGPEYFFRRLQVTRVARETASVRLLDVRLDDDAKAGLLRAAKKVQRSGTDATFFVLSIERNEMLLGDSSSEPRMEPGVYDVYATPHPLPEGDTSETPRIGGWLQVRWCRRYDE